MLPPRGGATKSSAISEGLKNTLASGLAAACSKTILAPFDTIKTVQQDVMGGTSLTFVQAVKTICGRSGGASNLYVRTLFMMLLCFIFTCSFIR